MWKENVVHNDRNRIQGEKKENHKEFKSFSLHFHVLKISNIISSLKFYELYLFLNNGLAFCALKLLGVFKEDVINLEGEAVSHPQLPKYIILMNPSLRPVCLRKSAY